MRCRPSRVSVLSRTAQSLSWYARGLTGVRRLCPTRAGGPSLMTCSTLAGASSPAPMSGISCIRTFTLRLYCSVSCPLTSSLLTLTCSSMILSFTSMVLCLRVIHRISSTVDEMCLRNSRRINVWSITDSVGSHRWPSHPNKHIRVVFWWRSFMQLQYSSKESRNTFHETYIKGFSITKRL